MTGDLLASNEDSLRLGLEFSLEDPSVMQAQLRNQSQLLLLKTQTSQEAEDAAQSSRSNVTVANIRMVKSRSDPSKQ